MMRTRTNGGEPHEGNPIPQVSHQAVVKHVALA
jgi:hypothetical protein